MFFIHPFMQKPVFIINTYRIFTVCGTVFLLPWVPEFAECGLKECLLTKACRDEEKHFVTRSRHATPQMFRGYTPAQENYIHGRWTQEQSYEETLSANSQ